MNIFTRPTRQGPAEPSGPAPVLYTGKKPAQNDQPWPRWDATFTALLGLVITAFAMSSWADKRPSQLASTTAFGILATLIASFAFEARSGLRNLVRADLMGIVALFYLTLYEFLFPQPFFDAKARDIAAIYLALYSVILGFAGLFIGRHLLARGRQPFERIMTGPIHPGWLIAIFWASFILGFLAMLIAVDFDIDVMLEAMTRVRFSRPWARGRFGDWRALLGELTLLLFLVPPIAGLILARRKHYSLGSIVPIMLGFAWVLFYGFTDGARSVFGAYLVTFMIAFVFASPPGKFRGIVVVCTACAAAMMLSTGAMLEMRGIGFKRWWNGETAKKANRYNSAVFVDDNLLVISQITQYFPARNRGNYLGLEIPYLALIRPIPRALWPGKPTGMSTEIAVVVGTNQMTVAATFVGEAYMSGGLIGVALEALVLGLMAAWWNRLASTRNSELGILVFASGFFAVTITMRSTSALTTAILPCIAGLVFGKYVIPKVRARFKGRPLPAPRLRGPPPSPPSAAP